jgi:hypothetical protein
MGDSTMDDEISNAARPEDGLFLDLGPQRERHVARLKDGEGALAERVREAILGQRDTVQADAAATIVPVVLLYRRRKGADSDGGV